jgi:gliding motility associated protien GldN
MKTRILVVILCLACVTSYAQKRKKKPVRRATTSKQATARNRSTTTSSQPGVDTAKRIAAAPAKTFDAPMDGYYKKTNILSAKVTPYPNLRESDVAFAKRVWREIDVREKMNRYLASPKARLIDILLTAIANGELTAYDPTPNPEKGDPNGDSFKTPLKPGQARSRLADSSVVDKFDKDGNKVGSTLMAGEFNPDSVVRFLIKEDWVFDRQRSIFEPRIVGIAPMVKPKAGGLDLDYQAAFWVNFTEARPIFATKEAVSRNSDATGLSFDDVFVKRLFTSFIVKESNDKDERIKDYATGIDKLYESDRIKKSLMDWELNLWQY